MSNNNYITPIGIILNLTSSDQTTSNITSNIKYAEFVQTSLGTNNSITQAQAIQYTLDIPSLVDTIGITTSLANNLQGTSFLLPIGTYIVDYEHSNIISGCSIGIYQGPINISFTFNLNTVLVTGGPGWIHGRSIIKSTENNQCLMVGSVSGPLYISQTDQFTARIRFLKIE
jgi:hypothetical protein